MSLECLDKLRSSFFLTLLYFFSIFFYFSDDLKIIKFTSVAVLVLFVIYQEFFLYQKFKRLNVVILTFSFIVLLSGYLSEKDFGHFKWHISVFSSILLSLQTIASFGYVEYIIINKKGITFLKELTLILGVCLFVTDIYLLVIFDQIVEEPTIYFIGNKFIISYYHILLFALIGTLYKISLGTEIFLSVLCVLISKIVYCSTGIIGSLSFCIFYFGRKYFSNLFFKPAFFIFCIILSSCFAIFVDIFINSPLFLSVLEFLGESPSLTGRTVIYAQILDIISARPLLGYGNANNSSYVLYYTEIGNAQNGFLADIVDWGLVGAVLFLILVVQVLIMCKNKTYGYNIICFLYMYIVTAMVEVTMGGKFIVAMSILLVASNIKDRRKTMMMLWLKLIYLPHWKLRKC